MYLIWKNASIYKTVVALPSNSKQVCGVDQNLSWFAAMHCNAEVLVEECIQKTRT